jgi:hypothetical protein
MSWKKCPLRNVLDFSSFQKCPLDEMSLRKWPSSGHKAQWLEKLFPFVEKCLTPHKIIEIKEK